MPHNLGLEIRAAVPDDIVSLHGLIGSMPNALQLQEAFLLSLGAAAAPLKV